MKTPTLWFLPLLIAATPVLSAEEPPVLSLYFLQQSNNAQQAFVNRSFIKTFVHNDFLLKELMNEHLATQWAYKSNRFLFATSYEGLVEYGTLRLSIGYAKLFAKKLSIATQFYYLLHHAKQYPAVHSISFDMSFQAVITPKMGIAVEISNPARLKYGISGNVVLPMSFSTNLYYQIAPKTVIATQASYVLNGNFNLLLQIMQQLKPLHLYYIISLHHTSLSAGLSVKRFLIQIETAYDWQLGVSAGVELIFFFNSRNLSHQLYNK